jgi:hypothetical protein
MDLLALLLALWLPGFALPDCADLDGTSCPAQEVRLSCRIEIDEAGVCQCVALYGAPRQWFCND